MERVLVVCRANRARSPLVAGLLSAALRQRPVEVTSAGIHARAGDPVMPETIELAARHGLDLADHVARPVEPELIAGAHLVVTLSEAHRDTCAPLVPGAGAWTFTLRELDRLAQDLDERPPGADGRVAWLARAAHRARPVSVRPAAPEDVADPIGRPWDAWDALEAAIVPLVARLAERLRGP